MNNRPYVYYDSTTSLCPKCLRRVDAKVIFQDGEVRMQKRCPEHGTSTFRISSDIEYYQRCRNYMKRSEMPKKFGTKVHRGCPYDCGLCTDHEQHSCLSLIEVTDRCNLACPTCYTESSPAAGRHRTMEEICSMIDSVVEHEGEVDVLQISGGEPTIHPDFFDILDYARTKPVRHLMVNTNGVRIANDPEFARKLAGYMPGFELYLQFDSLKPEALISMRGEDLSETRRRALNILNELNLSTTLVATLQKGLNDDELGEIIEFGLQQACVRGVTFQPTQFTGRTINANPESDYITLDEVRTGILNQNPRFTADDLIPVPCHPDALCMAYALKLGTETIPLTRYLDPAELLESTGNTIVFEQDDAMKEYALKMFSTGASPGGAAENLSALLCCLPEVSAPDLGYSNVFRIIIMKFLDAYDFDVRSVRKSCVHIAHPDGRIIPFETMNILYRDPEILDSLYAETNTPTKKIGTP